MRAARCVLVSAALSPCLAFGQQLESPTIEVDFKIAASAVTLRPANLPAWSATVSHNLEQVLVDQYSFLKLRERGLTEDVLPKPLPKLAKGVPNCVLHVELTQSGKGATATRHLQVRLDNRYGYGSSESVPGRPAIFEETEWFTYEPIDLAGPSSFPVNPEFDDRYWPDGLSEGRGLRDAILANFDAGIRATQDGFVRAVLARVPLVQSKTSVELKKQSRRAKTESLHLSFEGAQFGGIATNSLIAIGWRFVDDGDNTYWHPGRIRAQSLVVDPRAEDAPREWFMSFASEDKRASEFTHLSLAQIGAEVLFPEGPAGGLTAKVSEASAKRVVLQAAPSEPDVEDIGLEAIYGIVTAWGLDYSNEPVSASAGVASSEAASGGDEG